MKEIAFRVAIGFLGGLLGGMGLGGGTLLIPLLTLVMGVRGEVAAWVNLVSFIPTAAVALVIHARRGMIEWGAALRLLAFALLGALGGLFFSERLTDEMLRRAFGCFLIALGSLSLFLLFIGYNKKK